MKQNRKLVIGILVISGFLLALFLVMFYLENEQDKRMESKIEPGDIYEMPLEDIESYLIQRQETQTSRFLFIIPLIGLAGILSGTIVYSLFDEKINNQDKKEKKTKQIMMDLFSKPEQEVIRLAINNNGTVPQYNITHLDGMDKVKTHRLIISMENKGIIVKKRIGKVNHIELKSDLYEALK